MKVFFESFDSYDFCELTTPWHGHHPMQWLKLKLFWQMPLTMNNEHYLSSDQKVNIILKTPADSSFLSWLVQIISSNTLIKHIYDPNDIWYETRKNSWIKHCYMKLWFFINTKNYENDINIQYNSVKRYAPQTTPVLRINIHAPIMRNIFIVMFISLIWMSETLCSYAYIHAVESW